MPGRFLLNAIGSMATGLLARIALPLLGSSVLGLVLVALASRQETGGSASHECERQAGALRDQGGDDHDRRGEASDPKGRSEERKESEREREEGLREAGHG